MQLFFQNFFLLIVNFKPVYQIVLRFQIINRSLLHLHECLHLWFINKFWKNLKHLWRLVYWFDHLKFWDLMFEKFNVHLLVYLRMGPNQLLVDLHVEVVVVVACICGLEFPFSESNWLQYCQSSLKLEKDLTFFYDIGGGCV